MADRKIWLLGPSCSLADSDKRWSYDCAYGFVVRAATEGEARRLANQERGDEGSVWLDSSVTSCVEINSQGPEMIILRDFLNG